MEQYIILIANTLGDDTEGGKTKHSRHPASATRARLYTGREIIQRLSSGIR